MAGTIDAFQQAMNQGHSAAWDQEWEKAVDCYSAALKINPNHPQALTSLGLALFELNDFPASLKCYQKAAALASEDPAPVEKIARIYERMGQLNEAAAAAQQAADMHLKAHAAEKAVENWLRVLSLQPENAAVRSKLAFMYERLGRIDEAVTEYISTASAFQRAGDMTRAQKVVEYAQAKAPQNQEVHFALAMLKGGQLLPKPSRPKGGTGPMRMANVREMQASGESGPISRANDQMNPIREAGQTAMIQLAGLLFDQADEAVVSIEKQRGLSALTRGLSGSSDESKSSDRARIILHLGQAIDSQTQGDYQQAVVELDRAVQLGMNHPAAYFDLGLLLQDTNCDRSRRCLQQALNHPDFSLAAHLVLAQTYEKSEQWKEAAVAYLQALSLADLEIVRPDEAEELSDQYDALIDTYRSTDDTQALQRICSSVAEQLLRPDWRDHLVKARQQLPSQPEGSPPAPIAEMVLESRGAQVVEAMAQIRRLAASGMLRSAMEEAMYALQYAPAYLPLHVLLGDLLFQDGRIQDAVQKFTVVANLYLVRGDLVRAVRLFQRVSQLTPMDLSIRQRLIDLFAAQGKIDDALREYSNLADLYYSLAELDKARQACLDALKIAQKAKDNRAWGVKLLLRAADIDLQRLNFRQALRIFEQVRTIQPDNASARAHIVTLNFRLGQDQTGMKELDEYINYLDTTSRRAQAVEFITDLLVEYPDRPVLRKRLADLYIRGNQIQEAVAQLDASADALLKDGKHLEAVNLLETIVSLQPANAEEYRTALESLRRDMLRK